MDVIHHLQRFAAGSGAHSSGEQVREHRQLFVGGELEGAEGEVWEGFQQVEE